MFIAPRCRKALCICCFLPPDLYFAEYSDPGCEAVLGGVCESCRRAGSEVQIAMMASLAILPICALFDVHRLFVYFDLNVRWFFQF